MSKEQEMPKKKKRPPVEGDVRPKKKRPPVEGDVRPKKKRPPVEEDVRPKKKRPPVEEDVRPKKKRPPVQEDDLGFNPAKDVSKKASSGKKAVEKKRDVTSRKAVKDSATKKPAVKDKKEQKQNKKKKGNMISNIILALAICVFLVSGFMLIKSILPYFEGGAEYDDIKSLVITSEDEVDEAGELIFHVDFDKLKEINSDTVAWIRFSKPTEISYPIVQGTDNDKYLTATFQANDNKLGAIFVDYRNNPYFLDQNTIIYGHNMKIGGEMFSQLLEYKKESFYKENPYFYIYTPDGMVRKYEIFSAGVVADDLNNYLLEFESDEEFTEYLELCKSHSAYTTSATVDADSKIVSLSTCTNVRDDERFLVQGVMIEEKLVPEE